MAGCHEERLILDWLKEHAKFIRFTKHGELWELPMRGPKGETLYQQLPGTPGDWRSWKNALADLRRKADLGPNLEPDWSKRQVEAHVQGTYLSEVTGKEVETNKELSMKDEKITPANPPIVEPSLANRLKAFREVNGLSKIDMAEMAGVSINTITRAEAGENLRTPIRMTLEAIMADKPKATSPTTEPILKTQVVETRLTKIRTAIGLSELRRLLGLNETAALEVLDQDSKPVKLPLLIKAEVVQEVKPSGY